MVSERVLSRTTLPATLPGHTISRRGTYGCPSRDVLYCKDLPAPRPRCSAVSRLPAFRRNGSGTTSRSGVLRAAVGGRLPVSGTSIAYRPRPMAWFGRRCGISVVTAPAWASASARTQRKSASTISSAPSGSQCHICRPRESVASISTAIFATVPTAGSRLPNRRVQHVEQTLVRGLDPALRDYMAYLPLYNGIDRLAIGVPAGPVRSGSAADRTGNRLLRDIDHAWSVCFSTWHGNPCAAGTAV